MGTLTPSDAASIADIVYMIRDSKNVGRHFKSVGNKFEFDAQSRFEGVSGAFLVFKSWTGFGIVAKGIGSFENEALLAIRGTAKMIDWLTNFHANLQLSKTGKLVHAGFNETFNSFFDPVSQFLHKNNFKRVHCVGHSLGGALATLAADSISRDGKAEVCLYTFGSPRVGSKSFAAECTGQIKPKNIYRVYHRTDAVTLIPVWPFFHTPLPGVDCYIESPGMMPGSEYHDRKKYIASVKDRDWADLRKSPPETSLDEHIKVWLDSSDSIASFTVATVTMIQCALAFILKKVTTLAGINIQALLMSGCSLLDLIAMILEKGAQLSKEIAGWVASLMRKILKAAGMAVSNAVENITVKFIRWVLGQFSETLYRLARAAIRHAHHDTLR